MLRKTPSIRKFIHFKNERTTTVFMGDPTPTKTEITYFTNFLNQPTAVFPGVEKLAKSTNSVEVFYDIKRVERGYYTCDFVPLFEDLKSTAELEITERNLKYLDDVIGQEPQHWLWSHRRWKYKPEDFGILYNY